MSSSVDKSSVLDLCDFELAQIDAQQRKSGWTPWILWAAAAGLAWQSLTFLGGSRNWLEVGVCWGIFVLVADLLRSLFTWLNESVATDRRAGPVRFRSSAETLASCRPYFVFYAATTAGAAYLVVIGGSPGEVFRWLWLVFYGAAFIGLMLLVLSSLVDWPLLATVAPGSWRGFALRTVSLVCEIAALVLMLVHVLGHGIARLSSNDARLGAILLGLTQIFMWLLVIPATDPTRIRIVQIRRALSLSDITADDAKQRLDVVLHGAEQAVALRSRVQSCLEALDAFHAVRQSAETALTDLMRRLEAIGESDVGQVKACRKEGRAVRRRVVKAFGTLESRCTSFEARYIIMSTQGAVELRSLRDGLHEQVAACAAQKKAFDEKYHAFETKADEPPRPRTEVPSVI